MPLDRALIPVLVACGQVTERDRSGLGSVPIQLMAKACLRAAEDAGVSALLADVGHIAAASLTVDAAMVKTPVSRRYKNLPKSVANLLGVTPKRFSYVHAGGNTPQFLVNHFAEQISLGKEQTVLLTGGESLATMFAKFNRWYKWFFPKAEWQDDPGGSPTMMGDDRASGTKLEARHGLELPANVYPLFENALQAHYGRTNEQHRLAIGELFAKFTEVAAANPYAWFQEARTAQQLTTESAQNRMVAHPYTKNLNSMIMVNQAAAIVMTSLERAKTLGIADDKLVYLHGCADANDIWNLTERKNFHSSPAMRRCAQEALKMAGKSIDELAWFDLYSCFPAAVQIACDEFGLAHDDARGLTLTGGLPYFGGPGNNYSMHAIAEMMQRVRANSGDYGLLNANGWYLTKHSLGVYSNVPLEKAWQRADKGGYQAEILADKGPPVAEKPAGKATLETFTVVYDKKAKPRQGIVFGRLESGARFVANTPRDPSMIQALCDGRAIGRSGKVKSRSGRNTFFLD